MDSNALMMVVLLVFVGGMLYLSSRTRKKQMAAQQRKLDAIVPGVRVTTIAGLKGTVTAVADDTMELEISPGVYTTWLRAAVRDVDVATAEEFEVSTVDGNADETAAGWVAEDDKNKKDLG